MNPFQKKAATKKIVFGFNGSLDSIVGAYLLKRQGYEVIGLAVCFKSTVEQEMPKRYDSYGELIAPSPFMGEYIIDSLDDVRRVANEIGITFYATDASREYQDKVTDFVVGARIGGRSFSPKINTTELLFSILESKASSLGANLIGTGHYGKVVKNNVSKSHNIFVSQDLENDQSYLLSKCPENVLSKMYMPLSDMRKEEVIKIGKGLKIDFIEKDEKDKGPLMTREGLGHFVADRMPPSFVKDGHIIDYKNDSFLGEHLGIHNFAIGGHTIKNKAGTQMDKENVIIGFKYAAGTVYVAKTEDMSYQVVVLNQFHFFGGIDQSHPFEVYIKTRAGKKPKHATLYIHNNGYVELELDQAVNGFIPQGETVVLYSRPGALGKIMGYGVVRTCGLIENDELRTFPRKKDYIPDEEAEKIDISKFKF